VGGAGRGPVWRRATCPVGKSVGKSPPGATRVGAAGCAFRGV